MIIPQGAIIAVANGEKLSLYRNTTREPDITLEEIDFGSVPEENAGSGGRRVSTGANPAASQQAEDNFAAGIAALLNKLVPEKKIEKLYIIAAPRTLGELRRHISKQVQDAVVEELSKDLTGRSIKDIEQALNAADAHA